MAHATERLFPVQGPGCISSPRDPLRLTPTFSPECFSSELFLLAGYDKNHFRISFVLGFSANPLISSPHLRHKIGACIRRLVLGGSQIPSVIFYQLHFSTRPTLRSTGPTVTTCPVIINSGPFPNKSCFTGKEKTLVHYRNPPACTLSCLTVCVVHHEIHAQEGTLISAFLKSCPSRLDSRSWRPASTPQ